MTGKGRRQAEVLCSGSAKLSGVTRNCLQQRKAVLSNVVFYPFFIAGIYLSSPIELIPMLFLAQINWARDSRSSH